MKRIVILFLMIAAVPMALVPSGAQAAPASADYPDYFAIKGGYYYPSERMSIDEFDRTDFERRNGYTGELAWGHHYGPFIGTEFGVGYLQNTRFATLGAGRTRLQAVPLLLSLKVFLPLGPVEPYAEVGVGAYLTRLDNGARTFREADAGPHAGVGLNINFSETFYLGIEGRYRRVKPDYEGMTVRLDGYTATANLGFRYR
jgi:opacity protein-like surface antigen